MQSIGPDIIVRAKAGDREALGAIFRDTYHYVMGFAVRRASNYDYAEEAVAETYLTLVCQIAHYQDHGKIGQWLCGIARNHLGHIERREHRRAGPAVRADMAVADDIEWRILGQLGIEQARRLLNGLAPRQRIVLELRFIVGLDTATVADMLGVSRAKIKHRTFRGVQHLREWLKSEADYHKGGTMG